MKLEKELNNAQVLIYSYVDQLIKEADKLEKTQVKMQECNDFLQQHAARKTAYMSADYYS